MTHPLQYAISPKSPGHLVLGIASDGDHVVAVGGQGRDYYQVSEDGGRSFQPRESPGRGLRSAWVAGDDVWVCGEYGYAAHSPDRGHTWHVLETGSSSCLFGVAVVDGQLFLAGDGGFLIRVNPEGAVEYIELTREGFSRFSPHPEGLLLPSDSPGQLWVVGAGAPRKLAINAGYNLMKARVLESGTLMAVGAVGGVFRSEDDGETFRRVEGDFTGLLCSVESLGEEVYVVGEDSQIWRSTDDGRTFSAVEHELGSGYFWCCERVGDVLMIGAHASAVIQIGSLGTPGTRLSSQVEVGPPQQLIPRQRSVGRRPRPTYKAYSNYVRSRELDSDVEEFLADQPRAALPDVARDLGVADACLGTCARLELHALIERYRAGAVPAFDGLEVRVGQRPARDRATLFELFATAFDEPEARELASTVLESTELLATSDGVVLLLTHDGVWEWAEADPGLRRVCDDIGTLYHLLIRASAARLGRFPTNELVAQLDGLYDDWLEFEFFETSAS